MILILGLFGQRQLWGLPSSDFKNSDINQYQGIFIPYGNIDLGLFWQR